MTNLLTFLEKNIRDQKQRLPSLSMLTIVIPSYCRQNFIVRQCAYWHGRGASVLIMDGSPKPLANNVQELISSLDDITYVHSDTVIIDRLKSCQKLIKTPYTVMCGDDEFLLTAGLCSAIDLLERDRDLVACVGQSLRFYLSNNGSKCRYGLGYKTYRYSIKHDNVQDRINAAMKNYNAATCYAVTRSPVWCRSWGNVYPFSSSLVMELVQLFNTYVWGKLGSVDDVFWMRSAENLPSITPDILRLPVEEWWTYYRYKDEREALVKILDDEIIRAEYTIPVDVRSLIAKAIGIYLSDQKRNSNLLHSYKIQKYIIHVLKKLMPKALVGFLRGIKHHIKPLGNFGNLTELQDITTPLPFLLNDDLVTELSEMEKIIANFYKALRVKSK